MSLFHVGEVAIITESYIPEFPVGSEVTILEVCDPPPYENAGFQYVIARPNYDVLPGHTITIYGNDACLRKKPPPDVDREPLGRWDECPWSPCEISCGRYDRLR
jgi:hypothetical protein